MLANLARQTSTFTSAGGCKCLQTYQHVPCKLPQQPASEQCSRKEVFGRALYQPLASQLWNTLFPSNLQFPVSMTSLYARVNGGFIVSNGSDSRLQQPLTNWWEKSRFGLATGCAWTKSQIGPYRKRNTPPTLHTHKHTHTMTWFE